ncbi:MAG: hypothetical protein JXR37_21925 [Kiritimatiellae bacterium]|nr:hypothetical protein [Kiritimatiellia bacterium]
MEKLLELQDRDRQILHGIRESEDIPKKKQVIESELEKYKDGLGQAQEKLKANQASIKAVELEINTLREKVAKLRQQQLELKTNKEFQAMEGEVLGLGSQIKAAEDRAIELMEKVEEIETEIAERRVQLKTEEARIGGDLTVLDGRLQTILDEVARAKDSRETLAGEIDPAWLSRYDRIFRNKGDYAIVGIEHRVCGGCHMKLPPHVIQDVKKADGIVTCDFCGRILYTKDG